MKKYFLIAVLLANISLQAFSQSAQEVNNFKIDSLKKLLPSLKGIPRVDCMILICEHYSDIFKFNADSFHYYGNMAFKEANVLNYKQGIALSLLINAVDSVREKNIRQAIQIGEEINSDLVLGWGYYILSSTTKDFQQSEDYLKKAIYHFHKAGNTLREAEMTIWLSDAYNDRGEYEKAFDYAKTGAVLLKSASRDFPAIYEELLYFSSFDMSDLYSTAGDYESAMNYLRMVNQKIDLDIAGLFFKMGKYDSAMVYWNLFRNDPAWNSYNAITKANGINLLGEIYLANKQYDKAIELFKNSYHTIDTLGTHKWRRFGIMEASLHLGKAYDGAKSYNTALKYAVEGLKNAQEINRRPKMMEGYQLLSSVYHHLRNNDSAYEYLLKYNTIKDSIQNRQFLLRIYNSKKVAEDEKKQAQLLLLNKDNKVKTLQLKQESQQKNLLLILLSALVLAGFFVYRSIALKRKTEKLQREQLENAMKLQQLENEKRNAELQQQAAELEMQALRAQMNPHFIFNCLSSINRIILKNESQAASDYLTRFSRLIIMVIINSQKAMIPLEDELQMLRLYLDMERLRFKNSFDYSIIFTNTIDEGAVFIPPLLLQPFCENAIWHGLMQKEGHGHLNIELSMQDNILHCIISDDGIGREKAAALKSKSAEKEKSMGLAITAQRLALLNQNKNVQTFYTIEDNRNADNRIAGTKVILKIAYKEFLEEPV